MEKNRFDDLKKRAVELDFEGEEMRQWVKEQHDVERDFRVKERAHARRKEIKELEIIEKEKECARAKELKKLEHEEKEREYERERK